jgi:hypothetical protein
MTDARHGRIPASLLCDPNCPAESKALYALLEMHSGPDGRCFPSQELVGRMMGCDARTIRRWLSHLEREGHISISPRYDKRGMRAGVCYRLNASIRYYAQRAEQAFVQSGLSASDQQASADEH